MSDFDEERRAKIHRLYDRELTVASYSEDNPSNVLLRYSARELLKFDPFINKVWRARTAIIKNVEQIVVPKFTLNFFEEYTKGVYSSSKIIAEDDNLTPPFYYADKSTSIMYSGGSESVYMDISYSSVDLINIKNFFPHTKTTREFQLALIGLLFGYGVTNIGCGLVDEPRYASEYEFSYDFVHAWNTTFYPNTIQYPLAWQTKDTTYRSLLKGGLNFIACEHVKDGKECGKCWHCAEKYWYILALKTTPEFKDITLPYMDLAFLRKVQTCNRNNLKELGNYQRFILTTNLFKVLEQRYGVNTWYGGDPTQPYQTGKSNLSA